MANAAAPFVDEDALAAELEDDEVVPPAGAEDGPGREAAAYPEYPEGEYAGREGEEAGAEEGGEFAGSHHYEGGQEELYDEGVPEYGVGGAGGSGGGLRGGAGSESRERPRKRKQQVIRGKETKISGGRLTKVRRQGQVEEDLGEEDADAPVGGVEGDENPGEKWDQDNSEDDQEGQRTMHDDAFIDDAGAEQYDEEQGGQEEEEEDRVASLPQAEEARPGDDELERMMGSGRGGGSRKRKDQLSDSQKALFVEEFQAKLERAAADDAEANMSGRPAIHKLQILPELVKTLRKKPLQREFLDRGVFTILKNWLEPLPDWSLPNIKIRTAVLELLTELPIDVANNPERRRQLKESGLGKVVMFLSKLEQEETVHNRMLARDLVDTWSRPIFDKSVRYSDLRDNFAERAPRRTAVAPKARESQAADDLDDEEGATGSQGSRKVVTRIPQPAKMDFTVRPESRVLEQVMKDRSATQGGGSQFMKKLTKLKGGAGRGRIQRAEKVSVEGRGMVKYY